MPEKKPNEPMAFDLGLEEETVDRFELARSEAGQEFVRGGKKPKQRKDARSQRGKFRAPTTGGKLIRVTSDLDPALHKRLKMAAMRDNLAIKQLISDLIEEGLKARREAARASGEED